MNFIVTTPTFSVNNLFICQNSSASIAPVDGGFFFISKPAFVKKFKKPLRPAIIIFSASFNFSVPIISQAHRFLLRNHIFYVGKSPIAGFDSVSNRRIFRRHPESVKTHRVKDVKARHRTITRNNIADRIISDVPHVQISRRIGEHFERVIFRASLIDFSFVIVGRVPNFLPFLFNFLRIIFFQKNLPAFQKIFAILSVTLRSVKIKILVK